jgi:lactoylglutathione lyase
MTITRGVDHVGLSVRDLEASKKFFEEILEFKVIDEKEGEYAFVSDRTTMITLWQTANTSPNILCFFMTLVIFALNWFALIRISQEISL